MWSVNPFVSLALAALVSLGALRWGWLSASGAIAAMGVGSFTLGCGGWGAAAVLVGFFVSSSLLTRWRAGEKRRMEQLTARGGRRSALQVVANGGVATGCIVGYAFTGDLRWWMGFAGAYAAATSDTWSSEIGALSPSPPRHILSGKRVARGESGGVSLWGTLAGIGGSVLVAAIASATAPLSGWQALWIVFAGLVGNLLDSLLGATLQGRYRCAQCGISLEQPLHCGQRAVRIRGKSWMNNDMVNLCATLCAALIALMGAS